MINKEEVLRLAEESGLDTDDGCAYLRYNHDAYANVTQQITKLIDLAKQAGAEDTMRRELYCSTGVFNDDAVKERLVFIYEPDVDEAIRKIERKEL